METIKLPTFETEVDNDAMMYNAIYEYAPVWPLLRPDLANVPVETETETTLGLLIPAGGVAGRGFGGTSMRCADGRRCA